MFIKAEHDDAGNKYKFSLKYSIIMDYAMIMSGTVKINIFKLMFDFSWRQIPDLANHQTREKAARKHFSLGYQGDQGIK